MTTPHSFAHPDPQRLAALADVSRAWDEKRITLQEARAKLLPLAPIKPWEIALLEQRDTDKDTPDHDCRTVSIDEMLAIYAPYLDRSRPTDLPEDHPIAIYYREIDAWKGVLDEIVDLVQYPVIRNQWYALYDKLAQVKIHFQRKHHQLYSELERRGFDRPSKHMWLFDDYIRNAIRDARSLLEQETPATDEAFIAKQDDILRSCRDLIAKEETVLLPTSLALIPQDAFNVMKLGDAEIGYAWGVAQAKPEVPSAEPTPTPAAPTSGLPTGFMQELGALLGKYGLQAGGSTASPDGLLEVKTGKLSLEQINLIFQHLPIDISFVDEDEIVRFYTDTKHRIFPRSRNVIGRRVTNCHPSTSVHFVKEILAKFKSGEEDSVDFWINKPGKFIYILFVAIRDEAGRFRGVMEVMQDCTRIRELTDSRTLLTWSQETKEPTYLHGIAEPGEDVPVGKRGGFSRHPSSDDVPATTAPTASPTPVAAPTSRPQVTFTPETRLQTLIDAAPWLRQRLGDEVAHFRMLNSPMGDIMIPRATLGMMSEHSGVPFEALVTILKRLMAEKH